MIANICSILLLTAAAPAVAKTPEALIGLWKPVFAQIGDKPLEGKALEAMTMVIGPDGYVLGQAEGTLEPAGRQRNRLISRQKNGQLAGKDLPVLYELKADGLTMVTNLDGTRPTSLKPTGKPGNTVFRFTR